MPSITNKPNTAHPFSITKVRSPLLPTTRARPNLGRAFAMITRATTIVFLLATNGCCSDGIHPFTADDMCRVDPDESTGADTDPSGSSGAVATDGGVVWGRGDCCEQAGDKFGGICLLSDFDGSVGAGGEAIPPACIGCDWEPVLCMEQGCKTPNVI